MAEGVRGHRLVSELCGLPEERQSLCRAEAGVLLSLGFFSSSLGDEACCTAVGEEKSMRAGASRVPVGLSCRVQGC